MLYTSYENPNIKETQMRTIKIEIDGKHFEIAQNKDSSWRIYLVSHGHRELLPASHYKLIDALRYMIPSTYTESFRIIQDNDRAFELRPVNDLIDGRRSWQIWKILRKYDLPDDFLGAFIELYAAAIYCAKTID